jgi:NhaP-type Na+/H+ or K+/H+ antiporter
VSSVLAFVVASLVWIVFSKRLSSWSVTSPIVLTTAGFLAAHALGATGSIETEGIRRLIELTLAVVLFCDASSIALRWFQHRWRFPVRLLGIGLPLTMLAGVAVGALLLPGQSLWVVAVIATALAPTDAALGVSIIENERIPLWFRQVINVESGLNDGLATPVVSFCIAGAAAVEGVTSGHPGTAVVEILLGVALGLAIGAAAGLLLVWAEARGLAQASMLAVAPLVVAVVTYLLVVQVGGNGFVAAFVCGVGFGSATRRTTARMSHVPASESPDEPPMLGFTRTTASLLGFAVWFVFGESVLGSLTPDHLGQAVVYAVLSLTVLRMVPVALSLIGMKLPWDTVLLAGWLGPRGLASIIFAMLAADTLRPADGELVLTVVGTTVALSVLAHGLSAGPLGAWYATRHAPDEVPA